MLYRLDVSGELHPEVLELGLRRHLSGKSANYLTNTVVQIGSRQQAYVSLPGCNGCTEGRCLPGCRVELLRRTLCAACGASSALLWCKGLADRPYRTVVIARPGPSAEPLQATLLHLYQEARLILHWSGGRTQQLAQTVLLLTDANSFVTLSHVHDFGWSAHSFPFSAKVMRFINHPRLLSLLSTRGPYTPVLSYVAANTVTNEKE